MVRVIQDNHELRENVLEWSWGSLFVVLLCDKIPVLGSVWYSLGTVTPQLRWYPAAWEQQYQLDCGSSVCARLPLCLLFCQRELEGLFGWASWGYQQGDFNSQYSHFRGALLWTPIAKIIIKPCQKYLCGISTWICAPDCSLWFYIQQTAFKVWNFIIHTVIC